MNKGFREYLDGVFSINGDRAELAAAHALNWVTAGIAGGAIVSIANKDAPDPLLIAVLAFFFLLSWLVRYLTLGVEEQVEIQDG